MCSFPPVGSPQNGRCQSFVYKTQEGGYQLQCKDNSKIESLGTLWVGEYCDADKQIPCVDGKVDDADKKIILQAVRHYVDESKYIVPVTGSTKNVPRLKIDVARLKFTKDEQGDRIREKAEFEGYINIEKPVIGENGNISFVECRSSEPIYEKVVFETPTYKKANLPSADEMKFRVMKKAVADVINQFVPVAYPMLRPVKDDTERAKKLVTPIDAGNYEFAIKKGENILKTDKKASKDAAFLYNLGVAYEARASQFDGRLDKQIPLLEKAKEYYEKALNINSSDKEINKAYADVERDLRVLKASYKAQKEGL